MNERIRKIENGHILLWLLKDIFWVADIKLMGTIMIAPTLLVAIWITYRLRKSKTELIHNIAVICWICANSVWMIGEFYFRDGTRPIAISLFAVGILILVVYYVRILLLTEKK
jgi:hypothetical protein